MPTEENVPAADRKDTGFLVESFCEFLERDRHSADDITSAAQAVALQRVERRDGPMGPARYLGAMADKLEAEFLPEGQNAATTWEGVAAFALKLDRIFLTSGVPESVVLFGRFKGMLELIGQTRGREAALATFAHLLETEIKLGRAVPPGHA